VQVLHFVSTTSANTGREARANRLCCNKVASKLPTPNTEASVNNTIFTLALSFALFASLAACGGGEDNRIAGIGSQPQAWHFTQGQITSTGNALDVAIRGDGFFQVNSDSNMPMYTRRGSFHVDADGFIVNETGLRLLLLQDNLGPISTGTAVPLQLPSGYLAPVPTTLVSLGVNLDSSKFVTAPGIGAAINFDDAATYNNTTSISVYTAKGEAIALTVYFQKAATDSWNVYATANGISVAGSNAAPVAITNLVFPQSGVAPAQPGSTVLFDIPTTINVNGAATQASTGVRLDLSRLTEFGTYFRVMLINQNGSPGGIVA
jgi:flagellar hook protein FlgE